MGRHDFIKFPPRLDGFSPKIWLLLGEVQARITLIKRMSIPRDDSNQLRKIYLNKGVHGTTAIEGNTFSEEEVGRIIAGDLQAAPSRAYQQQQIDNMVRAFNEVANGILAGSERRFSQALLHEYHRIVLDELAGETADGVKTGEIRNHSVTAGRYLAPPVPELDGLLQQFCDWLNHPAQADAGEELTMPILKAIIAQVSFIWIHPYGDGNGRMARLIEFMLLLQSGVPDIAAHLLSNHYNLTRDRYIDHLQASHGEWDGESYPKKGNLADFIRYALEGFRDGLDEQLTAIHAMQARSIWRDEIDATFVREFSANLTTARQRQKRLLLNLSDRLMERPATKQDISTLSPALARAYAGKSMRTVSRDLNALQELNLLKRVGGGYLPNDSILRGFQARARANDE
ncbi:MAG: Fic family protein [Chloroflexi bacterium]|nr:Fic family protein [Chloroflexota bacterium]